LLFDEYAKQEQDDGVEVIAWLAAQPWCSGVVGMMGISWGGFNGLQIAARFLRPTDSRGARSFSAQCASHGPESAPPDKPTIIRRSDMRIERIDRLGLELGTHDDSKLDVAQDDPLSAVHDLRRTWTMSRDAWQIRIETQLRLSCDRNVFLLQGSLREWEGADEVCRREWDRAIPRDFL